MTGDDRPRDQQFDGAFREWAQQDPRTPAAVARQRVAARITAAGRPSPAAAWPRRLALAFALALVATSGAFLWRATTPTPAPAPAAEALPVLPDNVVQFWLDSETPVYFIVGPAGDAPGGTP